MLFETFLPNLVLFACGQAAACIYLRTGRFGIGAWATAALWVLADWALVSKLVYGQTGPRFLVPLLTMQFVAFVTIGALAIGLWRRRWSATAKQRPALFAAGLTQYLRSELDAAAATFRRLVRTDPWDGAAWVALGNVMRCKGRPAAARRCYRCARRVDRRRENIDFVDLQERRLQKSTLVPGPRPAEITTAELRSTQPSSTPAQS